MSEHTATLPPLPEGWVWTTLGETFDMVGGGTPSRENPEFFSGEIIWLTPTEIPKNTVSVIYESKEKITKEALRKSSAKIIARNSILMTSRASIGFVAIAGTEVTTNQGFASFISSPHINSYFLAYWIMSIKEVLISRATGTTFKEISKSVLRTLQFPLAPLAEQTRIVETLETLFTQLDAGVQALKRSQTNLQRYRAAVLKAACEGTLVAQDPNDEPASQLLRQILAERYQHWEDGERAKGKMPMPSNYKEPQSPNLSNLPVLPTGWTWASLGQVSWLVKDGPHYSPEYQTEGIPFISAGNVKPHGIDFKNTKFISYQLHQELSMRCKPEKGDILYTKGGTTGIARVNTYDIDFNVWVHVAVLKTVKSINNFYLQHILNSQFCYAQSQKYTHGVGNQDLGLTRMINIVMPLPPLAEQARIVEEVERRLSVMQAIEATIEANLARAERLRQSILKQAFSGQLVPQDPRDEPASALLERIQAERTVAPKTAKQRNQTRMDLE